MKYKQKREFVITGNKKGMTVNRITKPQTINNMPKEKN